MFCVFNDERDGDGGDGRCEGEGLCDEPGGGGGFILDHEEVGVEVWLD